MTASRSDHPHLLQLHAPAIFAGTYPIGSHRVTVCVRVQISLGLSATIAPGSACLFNIPSLGFFCPLIDPSLALLGV